MNKLYVAFIFLAMTTGEAFAGRTYRNDGEETSARKNALKKEREKYTSDRYGASAVVGTNSHKKQKETSVTRSAVAAVVNHLTAK